MENIFLGINIITIGALALSIIYTTGVVWRVEMKLDAAYKFFLVGIVFLFMAEMGDLYYSIDNQLMIAFLVKVARMLFVLFFLTGIIFMRDIARNLDGEIEKK